MLHNLTGWHALIILALVILVFGATKLPALAKRLGRTNRVLTDEVADDRPSGPAERSPAPPKYRAVTDRIATDPAGTGAGSADSVPSSVHVAPNIAVGAAENYTFAQPPPRGRS